MISKNAELNLEGIQGIIMTLVFIGILLGVGFLVLEEFRDQDALSDTASYVVNETGLTVEHAVSTVDEATADAFNTFSATICYCNATGAGTGSLCPENTTLVAANYTTDPDLGTLQNATDETYDDVACTYTFNYGATSWGGINDSISATGEIPGWLSIIVIITIVGILLAIVFTILPTGKMAGGFGGGGSGSGGTIAEI